MSGDLEEDKKSLHAVDWVIIAVYFILCLAIGVYVSIINSFCASLKRGVRLCLCVYV